MRGHRKENEDHTNAMGSASSKEYEECRNAIIANNVQPKTQNVTLANMEKL